VLNATLGANVAAYIGMVCDTLRNTIPKAIVFCQVREAKRALLNRFYAHVGSKEVLISFNLLSSLSFSIPLC
jgi:Dynamin GTPase effector domain